MKFTHDQLMRRFGEQPASCEFSFLPFLIQDSQCMYHPIVECKKATVTPEWKTSKGYGNMAGFLFLSIFIPSLPDVS